MTLVAITRLWNAAVFLFFATIPAALANMALHLPWIDNSEPPWAWIVFAILPALSLALAWAPGAKGVRLRRALGALAIIHLAVAGWFMSIGFWPLFAFGSVVADALLLASLLLSIVTQRRLGPAASGLLIGVGLFFGLAPLAAIAEGPLVARKADALAGERPYCLQTASQIDPFTYDPARNLFDLSGLKMRASLPAGGSTMFRNQHHGWLVVDGDRIYNWSYLRQSFTTDVGGVPSLVTCKAAPHFSRRLPFW